MNMYFIAIVLPEKLNEKILHYKNYMQEKYGCRVALKSPAHITMIPPYWMEEEKEAPLKNDLDRLSNTLESFIISTNHFSAFRPKTIFVALAPNDQLQEVKKKTDSFFMSNLAYPISIDT